MKASRARAYVKPILRLSITCQVREIGEPANLNRRRIRISTITMKMKAATDRSESAILSPMYSVTLLPRKKPDEDGKQHKTDAQPRPPEAEQQALANTTLNP